nr:MAG TPA: hypothetical protein [Caudoviricetes sp.]
MFMHSICLIVRRYLYQKVYIVQSSIIIYENN